MLDVMRLLWDHSLMGERDKHSSWYPKYRDKLTERFAQGERVKLFQPFKDQAERRLDILEAATDLNDLKKLPSNRFEALKGDRKGQFSIRINQQWRVCFEWPEGCDRPFNIEIVDYH